MAFLCSFNNAAQRRYRLGAMAVAIGYSLIFFGCEAYVHNHHPHDWRLGAAALLPTASIVGFIYIIARYLREETDEFVRDQFIRSLLWAIASLMSYVMFISFLRVFGWRGTTKPFTEYFVFCVTLMIAKFSYKLRDRAAADD